MNNITELLSADWGKYRTRVHVASPPEGLVQKCFRCGAVLTDLTNASMAGEWSPAFWEAGRFIGVSERIDGRPMCPISFYLMDHDATESDEVACDLPTDPIITVVII